MSNIFRQVFSNPDAPPLIISSVTGDAAWRHFLANDGQHEGCDAVELRLDTLPADISANSLLFLRPNKPVLLTLRHQDEGGFTVLSPAERVQRVRSLLPLAQALDWEIAHLQEESVPELIAEVKKRGIAFIASAHDFERTPATTTLQQAAARAYALGADCAKFAFTPQSEVDLTIGSALLQNATAPTAAMGMGKWGLVSRLMYSQMGSKLLYCSYSGCEAAVPGQMPDELATRLLPLLPR